MENVNSLAIGVAGGLIVLGVQKVWRIYHRKSIKDDIELLGLERKHLEEMKRSSVEMNRSAFRSIFLLFAVVCLANIFPLFITAVNQETSFGISIMLTLVFWAAALGLSLKFFKRYDNLKNFSEAIKKIDVKLERLNQKIKI